MNRFKVRTFPQASEQNSAQLEEDKKHLEFMNSIKKYDADVPSEAEVAGGDMTASVMDTSKVGTKIFAVTIKILSSSSHVRTRWRSCSRTRVRQVAGAGWAAAVPRPPPASPSTRSRPTQVRTVLLSDADEIFSCLNKYFPRVRDPRPAEDAAQPCDTVRQPGEVRGRRAAL